MCLSTGETILRPSYIYSAHVRRAFFRSSRPHPHTLTPAYELSTQGAESSKFFSLSLSPFSRPGLVFYAVARCYMRVCDKQSWSRETRKSWLMTFRLFPSPATSARFDLLYLLQCVSFGGMRESCKVYRWIYCRIFTMYIIMNLITFEWVDIILSILISDSVEVHNVYESFGIMK